MMLKSRHKNQELELRPLNDQRPQNDVATNHLGHDLKNS